MTNVTHIQEGKLAKRRYHNTMAIFHGVRSGKIPPRKKTVLETILYVLREDQNANKIHNTSSNSFCDNSLQR